MSLNRYDQRRDKNEAVVIEALENAGATVLQMSKVDLVVGFRDKNFLLEIKTDHGKPTKFQREMLETWQGQYNIVRTAEQALQVIGAVD